MNYIARLLKGTAKIVSDKKTILIHEGDVFYIPKNLGYQSYWYGEEINFLSIGFMDLGTMEGGPFELQVIPCKENLANRLSDIPTTGTKVSCEALCIFYDVMSRVIPLLSKDSESPSSHLAEKISQCIRDNPFSTLGDIATMCSVSEPQIYVVFKKIMHKTPNDYRQKVLCDKATELLITTDKNIEEISSILNFSSSSYFRKILKKHTGKTPREIRKSRGF